ncbi:four helix bundle protein [Candidatus Peregrinibacteria bacterium]|nr:four helix bundle protein [Candidatus Peregrinibacteria bacterium]
MNQYDIYEKCEDFAVSIIQLFETIPYRKSVGIISDQLIRSSGSVGANLNEANNARSKKEFISTIGICLREIKESIFWLKVLKRTNEEFVYKILETEKAADTIRKILGKIYWSAIGHRTSDTGH